MGESFICLVIGSSSFNLVEIQPFLTIFLAWGWKHDTKIFKNLNKVFEIAVQFVSTKWKLLQKVEHCQWYIKWKIAYFSLNKNFIVHLNANITVGNIFGHSFAQPPCFGKLQKHTKLLFLQVAYLVISLMVMLLQILAMVNIRLHLTGSLWQETT